MKRATGSGDDEAGEPLLRGPDDLLRVVICSSEDEQARLRRLIFPTDGAAAGAGQGIASGYRGFSMPHRRYLVAEPLGEGR